MVGIGFGAAVFLQTKELETVLYLPNISWPLGFLLLPVGVLAGMTARVVNAQFKHKKLSITLIFSFIVACCVQFTKSPSISKLSPPGAPSSQSDILIAFAVIGGAFGIILGHWLLVWIEGRAQWVARKAGKRLFRLDSPIANRTALLATLLYGVVGAFAASDLLSHRQLFWLLLPTCGLIPAIVGFLVKRPEIIEGLIKGVLYGTVSGCVITLILTSQLTTLLALWGVLVYVIIVTVVLAEILWMGYSLRQTFDARLRGAKLR